MTNLNWDRVRDDEKLKAGRECNYYGETSITDHEGSLDSFSLAIAKSKRKKRKLAKQAAKLNSKAQAAKKAKIKAESKNKIRKSRKKHSKEVLALKKKKYRSRTIEFEFNYLSDLLRYNRFPKTKERAAMVTFRNWYHLLHVNNNLITLHTLLCTTLKGVIRTRLFNEEHKKELSDMYNNLLPPES